MSKASEYAARVIAAKNAPPDFVWTSLGDKARHNRVSVSQDGWLWTCYCDLPPEQALKLADWIYSNFAEDDK